MKKQTRLVVAYILVLSFSCINIFGQVNEDSVMLANSEQWKIEPKKGLFGLSKPSFGNFTTVSINKIDSGFYKKKIKDSSSFDFELGSGENDVDQSKYMTIQKTKWYKLMLAADTATTSATFSIASVSKEKKQTLLGKMLSKNDEGKDEELSYRRDVPGFISTGGNAASWQFLIHDFTRGSGQTGFSFGAASISSGYLQNESDSLYMQLYSSFAADLVLVKRNGEHVAALKFKQKPLSAWIRNDLDSSHRDAIAALFAVIIAIKDF
ncbi:MAG TPA: hypothetical protein VGP55_14355 [Chitinophagaceae bacterium]|nr:hypothetical protein [Chitinophagaceae bacterium]